MQISAWTCLFDLLETGVHDTYQSVLGLKRLEEKYSCFIKQENRAVCQQ